MTRRVVKGPTAIYTYVYGLKGMGKSLYARGVILRRMQEGGRVVIIDPAGSLAFQGIGREVSVRAAVAGLKSKGAGPFAIRLRPEWEEDITDVFKAVFDAGRLLLVVDEAHDYGSASSRDANFLRLMQKGRNQYIDVLTTALGPVGLLPELRNLADVVVSFRQSEPEYARKLAEWFFRDPRAASCLVQLPPPALSSDRRGGHDQGHGADTFNGGGVMKVRELIAALSAIDPNTEVVIPYIIESGGYTPVGRLVTGQVVRVQDAPSMYEGEFDFRAEGDDPAPGERVPAVEIVGTRFIW